MSCKGSATDRSERIARARNKLERNDKKSDQPYEQVSKRVVEL